MLEQCGNDISIDTHRDFLSPHFSLITTPRAKRNNSTLTFALICRKAKKVIYDIFFDELSLKYPFYAILLANAKRKITFLIFSCIYVTSLMWGEKKVRQKCKLFFFLFWLQCPSISWNDPEGRGKNFSQIWRSKLKMKKGLKWSNYRRNIVLWKATCLHITRALETMRRAISRFFIP